MSILHPTDFSEGGMLAFAHSLKMAVQHQAHLSILHVGGNRPHDHHWEDFPSVRTTLQRWKLLPPGAPRSAVYDELSVEVEKIDSAGPVTEAIIEFCEHRAIDLVVLATHGREGVPKWLRRSIAEPVARRARVATLFVPHHCRGFVSLETGSAQIQRVLMPVDHVPDPQSAIPNVLQLLRDFGDQGSEITLVHSGNEAPDVQFPSDVSTKPNMLIRDGNPVDEILAVSDSIDPDLIVMVTVGHQGFLDAIRGSTTERVVRHAPCPVLAVPGTIAKTR